MTTINIYLTFNGNCEEAFDFYKSIFGGEYQSFSRFNEMPPQDGMPPISDAEKDLIMHVTLPISKETVLMGSDTGGEWAQHHTIGNNFSISINVDETKEADRFFEAIAKEGKVTVPMDNTFWGSYFGMVTDKFGINWMIGTN